MKLQVKSNCRSQVVTLPAKHCFFVAPSYTQKVRSMQRTVYWVARSCPLCSLKLQTSHRRLGVETGKLRIDFVTKAVGHEHARRMCLFALNWQHYRYEHPIFPFMTGGAQRSCAACTAMTDVHLSLVGVWADEDYQVPCKLSWLQLSTDLRTTHPSAQAIARSADFTRRRRASLVLRRGSFDGDAWWWGKQRDINYLRVLLPWSAYFH